MKLWGLREPTLLYQWIVEPRWTTINEARSAKVHLYRDYPWRIIPAREDESFEVLKRREESAPPQLRGPRPRAAWVCPFCKVEWLYYTRCICSDWLRAREHIDPALAKVQLPLIPRAVPNLPPGHHQAILCCGYAVPRGTRCPDCGKQAPL